MTGESWRDYFENTKHKPPARLLIKAVSFAKARGHALDVGAGALNDAFCLLKEGFTLVTAIDVEPMAQEIVDLFPKSRFDYVISSAQNFSFPVARFDLVNAQYSLPFISPTEFHDVWCKIINSLTHGGIFTGQLFGNRDEWASKSDMSFHRVEEAREFLSTMKTILFNEDENDGPTAMGTMKHWHVYHFIASK
jgi:hypothetical protein